jgi:transposase
VARYKERSQENLLVPINLGQQLIPGSFEFTLNRLVDELDLSAFDQFYSNDEAGAKAYSPQAMLKVILYAYSKGLLSSRKIEVACQTNVVFMALSGEATPDHATVASFVSNKGARIKEVFVQILAICAQLDLIGMEQFALDGCKLPSNAAKEHSGTFAEYQRKIAALETKVEQLMKLHQVNDIVGDRDRIEKAIKRIQSQKKRIERFLQSHSPRTNHGKREVKSNITDNESAKLKTSSGYIQGYNTLALTDAKHQVVLNAYPIGRQFEGDELEPFLNDSLDTAKRAGILKSEFRSATLLADTNYFSEHNCRYLLRQQRMDAVIPDPHFRSRDLRFDTHRKAQRIHDFIYEAKRDAYRCPNGKLLAYYCRTNTGKYPGRKYRAQRSDCGICPLANGCLARGARRRTLRVVDKGKARTYAQRMVDIIDSAIGRQKYSRRMAIVEPVFANLKSSKGMIRFTLRGRRKVSIQRLFYCLVHNIEKVATTGAIKKLATA